MFPIAAVPGLPPTAIDGNYPGKGEMLVIVGDVAIELVVLPPVDPLPQGEVPFVVARPEDSPPDAMIERIPVERMVEILVETRVEKMVSGIEVV